MSVGTVRFAVKRSGCLSPPFLALSGITGVNYFVNLNSRTEYGLRLRLYDTHGRQTDLVMRCNGLNDLI